jgi:hypothetical protein
MASLGDLREEGIPVGVGLWGRLDEHICGVVSLWVIGSIVTISKLFMKSPVFGSRHLFIVIFHICFRPQPLHWVRQVLPQSLIQLDSPRISKPQFAATSWSFVSDDVADNT